MLFISHFPLQIMMILYKKKFFIRVREVDVDVECSILFIHFQHQKKKTKMKNFPNCLQVCISLFIRIPISRAPISQPFSIFVCIHFIAFHIKYSLNRLQLQTIQITQNGIANISYNSYIVDGKWQTYRMPGHLIWNGKRNLSILESYSDFITTMYCFCLTSNCILTSFFACSYELLLLLFLLLLFFYCIGVCECVFGFGKIYYEQTLT